MLTFDAFAAASRLAAAYGGSRYPFGTGRARTVMLPRDRAAEPRPVATAAVSDEAAGPEVQEKRGGSDADE